VRLAADLEQGACTVCTYRANQRQPPGSNCSIPAFDERKAAE
jgi:hypothetical protein